MITKKDRIIVTAALPYANGEIHIGHLLEYVQADIFTRFLKMQGKNALYICASDMHGTPIEVNAKKAGTTPEKFTIKFWKDHQQDFKLFHIEFDNYHKTHSPENKELSEYFFRELKKKGYIYTKKINIIYCNNCSRSLPDRYVRGTCPNCATEDQYGDICESCGSALKATDLINPKCSICGRAPIQKESEHYFFSLSKFSSRLKKWINAADSDVQKEVRNWLDGWLKKGLEDWCISRDAPYFGFEIPDSKKETGELKYFYVWLDAPIGYISSSKNYCDKAREIDSKSKVKSNSKNKSSLKWEDYWKKGQVYHIIGKDIAYFHYLFWPAMLMGVGIPVPKLTTHGWITVNGEKMSKSRGTFFTAKDFHKLYPAEALRFYYASHLDRKVIDVDINFTDFMAVNNNVLMGCLGNFCYRVLTFAEKNYGGVKAVAQEKARTKKVEALIDNVKESYQKQDFKSAVKDILKIADIGNSYFQNAEPWKGKGSDDAKERQKAEEAVGWCVNLARNLAIVAAPILPEFSQKTGKALGDKGFSWKDIVFGWKCKKLGKIELLVKKIENVKESDEKVEQFPLNLVVGKIVKVKDHSNADSLYLLNVDLGEDFGKKQVVAGLKKYMQPKELINRKVVFCVNMKPAKLRGELSEAMILAADDSECVALLEAEKSKIGQEVCFKGLENSKGMVTFEDFKGITMQVLQEKVVFQNKTLSSKTEDIVCKGVKEGARVY